MSDYTDLSETASETRNRRVPECEAMYNVSHIYTSLIKRSYELPFRWFYITFKPFNDSYNEHEQRYQNCLNIVANWCRTRSSLGVLTRETEATKTHVNALLCSRKDLSQLHGTNINKRGLKYKLHVQHVAGYSDRQQVLTYMCKESDHRPFNLYVDHMSIITSQLDTCPERSDPLSDDPEQPIVLKRSLFNVCNNNKLKFTI